MDLNEFIDFHYGNNGDAELNRRLSVGDNPEARSGPMQETALHVAARRRRLTAVEILLQHGAAINAKTSGGKTAFAHAIRRGFTEITDSLQVQGADLTLNPADQFAVAVTRHDLAAARTILAQHPQVIKTGNPEEDRLLADMAGRGASEPVAFLIAAGADLSARALDDGTALHQAAWFGQPQNARLLIDAGAALEVFDAVHQSSPLGWAVHGSRFSGDAENRQDAYIALTQMFLDAGASLHYPDSPDSTTYQDRLLQDASPGVRELLNKHLAA